MAITWGALRPVKRPTDLTGEDGSMDPKNPKNPKNHSPTAARLRATSSVS